MNNKELLDRLDELVERLTEFTGVNDWEIRLHSNLANQIFGQPLPLTYKGNFIVVDEYLMEIKTDEGMKSDVWVVPR